MASSATSAKTVWSRDLLGFEFGFGFGFGFGDQGQTSMVGGEGSVVRISGVGVGGAPVRGWAAADGARARGCVYEEVRARAAACPAHHPFTHDRPVATAVRVVLGAGPLPVGQDACGAAALDDARRRSTAATAVDTALHEKVLLGAVQLATALVGGGKPGKTELQRYVALLAGRTGGCRALSRVVREQ